MKGKTQDPAAARRWEACLRLDGRLAKVEPGWTPQENYYYPLKPAPLSAQDIAGDWREALARRGPGRPEMTSLYVHIPFCYRKCLYCVYYSKGGFGSGEVKAYVGRLHDEIDFYAPIFKGTRFDAWSIGGGTPTALSAEDLDGLLGHLRRAFVPKENASLEFETSPYTAKEDRIEAFRKHGFGRASFGVQSFSSEVLGLVGRGYQKAAHVRRCMELLKARGFVVNMDLLYGLPGGGVEEALLSARAAMELEPNTIIIYPLSAATPVMPKGLDGAALEPLETLAGRIAPLAQEMRYSVRSDWFSIHLDREHDPAGGDPFPQGRGRGAALPARYDDLHAGPLLLMGLGPSSRCHIYGRLAYAHDDYPVASPLRPREPIAHGWRLTAEAEKRIYLTRTLSRSGRIAAAEYHDKFQEGLEDHAGRDLDALVRLGVMSREGSDYRLTERGARERHAPELFLLGERIRRDLERAVDLKKIEYKRRRIPAAGPAEVRGIVDRGIRGYAAGDRANAMKLFEEAAELEPGGLGGLVREAAESSKNLQAFGLAVRRRGSAAAAALDLRLLEEVLERIRRLNDEGIRAYAAGERAKAVGCFTEALSLDAGDPSALLSLAAIASVEGRICEALDFYGRAAASGLQGDAAADLAGSRASLLERLGRQDEAAQELEAALRAPGVSPERRERIAQDLGRLSAGRPGLQPPQEGPRDAEKPLAQG